MRIAQAQSSKASARENTTDINCETDLYDGIFALDYQRCLLQSDVCLFCKVAEEHPTFKIGFPTSGSSSVHLTKSSKHS